jgi:hypothetical protein
MSAFLICGGSWLSYNSICQTMRKLVFSGKQLYRPNGLAYTTNMTILWEDDNLMKEI